MSTYNDIARYVEGEMTADERSAFEVSLATDEGLRQQLALYQEVDTSLQNTLTPMSNGSHCSIPCNRCGANSLAALRSRQR